LLFPFQPPVKLRGGLAIRDPGTPVITYRFTHERVNRFSPASLFIGQRVTAFTQYLQVSQVLVVKMLIGKVMHLQFAGSAALLALEAGHAQF
jgi:hypothetical protein